MELKLYRGITLAKQDVDRVIEDVKLNGINVSEEARWKFQITFIKDKVTELFEKNDLSTLDTRPQKNKPNDYTMGELINPSKTVCFADKLGATYYAVKHNKTKEKTVPILIETEIDLKNIIIDGRDFLYTCFQFLEMKDINKQKKQINDLTQIFGKSIEKYLIKSSKTDIQDTKIALCDLATHDDDVIKEHYLNKIILGGKHNTIFRTAFHIKTPIRKEYIKSVSIIEPNYFYETPQVNFKDII